MEQTADQLMELTAEPCLSTDPVESAEIVGLHYVTDGEPGIIREKSGEEFLYISPDGKRITDERILRRIKALVIPPAWRDVWISALETGHLQATGRDAKGRKQYRYHKLWGEIRGQTKFSRMVLFGGNLPAIRQRTARDLARHGLARNRVLATVVSLLETSLIRIGNEEYARENESFGLTTLRTDHIEVSGSAMRFHFRGKSGKYHALEINDRRLTRIIRRCADLPGQELFRVNEDGDIRTTKRRASISLPKISAPGAGQCTRRVFWWKWVNSNHPPAQRGNQKGLIRSGKQGSHLQKILCPPGHTGILCGRKVDSPVCPGAQRRRHRPGGAQTG